jgi:hypothetical protein
MKWFSKCLSVMVEIPHCLNFVGRENILLQLEEQVIRIGNDSKNVLPCGALGV